MHVLEQDTSCSSAPTLSSGKANVKQGLYSAPFMQNMVLSLQPSENSSPSNELSKNWYTAYTWIYIAPGIHAEVFEDKNSAYLLATNHCLSEHQAPKC